MNTDAGGGSGGVGVGVGGDVVGGVRPADMDWNSMEMWTTSPFAVDYKLNSSTKTGETKVYRDYEIVNMMIQGSAKKKKPPRLFDETKDPYSNDEFITKMVQGSKRFRTKGLLLSSSGKTSC